MFSFYYLVEGFFSSESDPEKELLQKERETKPFVWLYHTSPEKNVDNIKRVGLSPSYMGGTHYAPIEHPSGKKALSYSSSKAYSMVWGGWGKNVTLLVKVPTKDLFFAIRDKRRGWDEYQSIDRILPKNIVFPDNKKYGDIERGFSYLDSSEKI